MKSATYGSHSQWRSRERTLHNRLTDRPTDRPIDRPTDRQTCTHGLIYFGTCQLLGTYSLGVLGCTLLLDKSYGKGRFSGVGVL